MRDSKENRKEKNLADLQAVKSEERETICEQLSYAEKGEFVFHCLYCLWSFSEGEIPLVDRQGQKITVWMRILPVREREVYLKRNTIVCVWWMNSLWKQEFRQRIGIGRTRIRPQNGERRKLGKALQSARAQANILKQERSYSGQKRKSRYNLRDPPVAAQNCTHTLALRQRWLCTLAGRVPEADETQSCSRGWDICHTSGITFFSISDLFWSKYVYMSLMYLEW